MEIVNLPLEEVLALPTYPTADIFPMMLEGSKAPDGYEGMTIDQFSNQISKEGVREPLVLWGGLLLDGRNRREAARLANKATPGSITSIPVRYVEFEDEEDADSWILSLNIDRRNMNKDQLACLAVRFWEVEAERARDRKAQAGASSAPGRLADKDLTKTSQVFEGNTRDVLSRRFHVSRDYIQKARNLFLNDLPKFEQAASGRSRVIGKMISPGQQITKEENPLLDAQTNWKLAEAKVKQGAMMFRDLKEDIMENRHEVLQERLKEILAKVFE